MTLVGDVQVIVSSEDKSFEDNNYGQSDTKADLLNKKKNAKLSTNQVKLLISKLNDSAFKVSELSRIYNVSRSTLAKLKKSNYEDASKLKLEDYQKLVWKQEKRFGKKLKLTTKRQVILFKWKMFKNIWNQSLIQNTHFILLEK